MAGAGRSAWASIRKWLGLAEQVGRDVNGNTYWR
jgi:hypothetical protein